MASGRVPAAACPSIIATPPPVRSARPIPAAPARRCSRIAPHGGRLAAAVRGVMARYREMEREGKMVDVEKLKAENRFYRQERLALYQKLYGHLKLKRMPGVEPIWNANADDVAELMTSLEEEREALRDELERERETLTQKAERMADFVDVERGKARRARAEADGTRELVEALERAVMEHDDPAVLALNAAQPFRRQSATHIKYDGESVTVSKEIWDSLEERIDNLELELQEAQVEKEEAARELPQLREQLEEARGTLTRERAEWSEARDRLPGELRSEQETARDAATERTEMAMKLYTNG
eukprot:gene16974-16424_t